MEWALYALVALVAVVAFMQKPKVPGQKAITLDDINAPSAEEGKVLGVIFGTPDIEDPNCAWYGDLHVKTKKLKGSGKK